MFKKITTGLVKNENGVIVDIFRSRSTMGCEISGQKYLLYIDNEKIGEKNVSRINLLSARKQQEFFSAEQDNHHRMFPFSGQCCPLHL